MATISSTDTGSTRTSIEDLYSVQKGSRGDIWLLLAIIIPISIINGSVSLLINDIQVSGDFLYISWILFSFEAFSGSFTLPIKLGSFDILGLNLPILTPLDGNPLFAFFSYVQFFALVFAILFRFIQEYNFRQGKIIESGIAGLFGFLIIILEVFKILISDGFMIDALLLREGETWTSSIAESASIVNKLVAPLTLIPGAIDIPFLDTPIMLPFSFTFVTPVLMSIGLLIPILWIYREFKAFPNAFKKRATGLVRYTIIGIFVIISVFPLIWIVFISFNENITLRAGQTVWPLNLDATTTFKAWEAFFRIDAKSGYNTFFFADQILEGELFIALSLFLVLISLVFYKLRKRISNNLEKRLSSSFRPVVRRLSQISGLFLGILFFLLSYNILFFELLDKSYTSPFSLGGFTIRGFDFLGPANFVDLFLFLGFFMLIMLIVVKPTWFNNRFYSIYGSLLDKKTDSDPNLKLLQSFLSGASTLLLLLFSVFLILIMDLIEKVLMNDFDPFLFIFLTTFLYLFLSYLLNNKAWFNSFEGYYIEDGMGINFSIITGIIAMLLFFTANNAIKWTYYQWETQKIFDVGNWFFITISLCIGVSLIVIIISSISAYSLSRFRFRGRGLFGGMILSTQIFPGVILVLPLFIMMARLNLTGQITGLGFAYLAIALPFVTYLLKGFFDSIPVDLEEQAMIDGTTRLGAFRKVVLPLVMPGLVSTFIFSFLAIYTEYLMALIIYNPIEQDNYTIALAMLKVFQADITQRGVYFNELAVFAIIVAFPVILMFTYLQRYLLQGLVAGGTKG